MNREVGTKVKKKVWLDQYLAGGKQAEMNHYCVKKK